MQVMENELATPGCDPAKLRGFLKKLTDTRFLTASVLLKQMLDVAATASLKLEKQSLMIFDVGYIIEMCMNDVSAIELSLASEGFEIDGEFRLEVDTGIHSIIKLCIIFSGATLKRKMPDKNSNLKDVSATIVRNNEVTPDALEKTKNDTTTNIRSCLSDRFKTELEEPVYKCVS